MILLSEADLAREFPDVFDGSLLSGEYNVVRDHYLVIAKAQLKKVVEVLHDKHERREVKAGQLNPVGYWLYLTCEEWQSLLKELE